jgi:hypothetical protein
LTAEDAYCNFGLSRAIFGSLLSRLFLTGETPTSENEAFISVDSVSGVTVGSF